MIERNQLMQKQQFVMHLLPDEPLSDPRETHVWFCDLDNFRPSELTASCLSTSEHDLVKRLKTEQDRKRLENRFIFVRAVLGNITGIEPSSLEFSQSANGKPQLASSLHPNDGKTKRLDFNISRTENILALAVVFDNTTGVDIEAVKPGLDFFDLAMTHFNMASVDLLRALPPSKASPTFYRFWTRKEALAKMDGTGIAVQPNTGSSNDSELTLYSFEFKLDNQEIVGALALRSSDLLTQQN